MQVVVCEFADVCIAVVTVGAKGGHGGHNQHFNAVYLTDVLSVVVPGLDGVAGARFWPQLFSDEAQSRRLLARRGAGASPPPRRAQ